MFKHSQLSKADQRARLHYFHLFRAESPSQPILTTWINALRHVHFVKTLRADVAAHAKRSKAAKKSWKARRRADQNSGEAPTHHA